jgi:methylenetetrahydrofolate reductase (NADPH)
VGQSLHRHGKAAPDGMAALIAGSRLEQVLRSGGFAVTAEINAPDSADPGRIIEHGVALAAACDAVNVPDASGANVHISGLAVSALLIRQDIEPILQLACRDRNRIALQGDLLGGAALGVRNVLCLTGDGVQAGDQPAAKAVFDFDSIALLQTARILRDEGHFLNGGALDTAPRLFLGAAENPFAPPLDFRPLRLQKKIEAGANFIQTQFCFDVPQLQRFMKAVRDLGLHERAFILIGVGPLRSARSAEWMRAHVPGVVIPEHLIRRLASLPAARQFEEGKRICLEIITQIREIEGVHGVHVMAYHNEALATEIIAEAGLLPRPALRATQEARPVQARSMPS